MTPSSNRPLLLVRADAGPQIGAGHLMRCLALAQAWQDGGGDALFVMATCARDFERRLRDEGVDVVPLGEAPGGHEDASGTARIAHQAFARWIVVDGYQFDADYRRKLKAAGASILLIDDLGCALDATIDAVLNQNPHATPELYPGDSQMTHLLLGPRYTLLRREFRRQPRHTRRAAPTAGRLLVTLGGSDEHNVTAKVIDAVGRLDSTSIDVVVLVGPANPHIDALQAAAERSPCPIRLVTNAGDVSAWMSWADIAVSAAGGTCWELAFMGVPACIVVVADNQRPIADWLANTGIAVDLGPQRLLTADRISTAVIDLLGDVERRRLISEAGQALIDGLGAERVCRALRAGRAVPI